MLRINIHEAKTHLSKYLRKVKKGETILLCKRNVPVAEIRPLAPEPKKEPRKLGLCRGEAELLPSFFDPMTDEELRLWYEGDVFPPAGGT